MKTRTTRYAAALALPLALGLGACSNSGSDSSAAGSPSAAAGSGQSQSADPFTVAPGTDVDVASFLKQTQDAQQAKKTFHLDMTMSMSNQKMTMTGDQDVSDPNKPKAKISVSIPGQPKGMTMILDGDNVYTQTPGQAGGKFVKMSMSAIAANGGTDLKKMMNPAEALKAQEKSIDKITFKGEEDVSGTKMRHYAMLIDPVKAQQAAGQTNMPAPTGTAAAKIPYDVWVDGDKLVRKMSLKQSSTSVEMNVSKYGEPVQVTAPPAAQVTTPPGAPGQANPSPSATKG